MKHRKQTDWSESLKGFGLKVTQPRLAILDSLNGSPVPLSAQEIHRKVKSAKADQATIYRNLQTLATTGLIRRVNFQHDHNHYELAGHHHHHVICENCGKVADISKCDITTMEKQAKAMSGFAQINSHALEFFGLCKNCAAKKSKVI